MSSDALVVGESLHRRFGAVQALTDVSFSIDAGEIVGFAGDNGAGKSTLMKIVSGALRPTAGRLLLLGSEVVDYSPRHLRERGVEMVYQDLALCENLSIRENVFLGRLPRISGWRGLATRMLDRREMARRATETLERVSIAVSDVRDPVARLSGGQKQGVAICRALAFRPRLMILDEPTAALSVNAIEPVLELIRRLPAEGAAVMLVSHRLTDLLTTTNRIYVLRSGRLAAAFETGKTDESEILHAMAGVTRSARTGAGVEQ